MVARADDPADPAASRKRRPWRIVLAALLVAVLAPAALIAALLLTNPNPRSAPGWADLAPMPSPQGEVASATREVADGGELYVAGGFTPVAATSDRVRVYRTAEDAWEELPSLPEPRHHAAAALHGGDLFVNGGSGATTSRSPRGEHWVLREGGAEWEQLERMPEGRWGHRMVSLDGLLYVVGGEGPSASVLIFSEEDGWSAGAELPVPRDHLAAVVRGGQIWAIGGRDGDGGPVSDVHVYDPTDDAWREGPSLAAPISAGVEGVLGGDIHLVGGEDPALLGGGIVDRHLVLRRGEDEWEELAPPPLAVHGAGGGAIGGRLLVAGGASRHGLLSTLSWTDYAARYGAADGGEAP